MRRRNRLNETLGQYSCCMNPADIPNLHHMRRLTGTRPEPPLSSIHLVVLDNMVEGVSVLDESGYIVYTNAAEDRMFGYQRGELIGRLATVQNADPEPGNHFIDSQVTAQLQSTGEWSGERSNRKKDGTPFYTSARIISLEDDGATYWICFQQDLSDRRRNELELRDANEALHALIQASPLPIVA